MPRDNKNIHECVEVCPHCMGENILQLDPETENYEAECQHCGKKIMLCDECLHAEDNTAQKCDWTEEGGCFRKSRDGIWLILIADTQDIGHLGDLEGYIKSIPDDPEAKAHIKKVTSIGLAKGSIQHPAIPPCTGKLSSAIVLYPETPAAKCMVNAIADSPLCHTIFYPYGETPSEKPNHLRLAEKDGKPELDFCSEAAKSFLRDIGKQAPPTREPQIAEYSLPDPMGYIPKASGCTLLARQFDDKELTALEEDLYHYTGYYPMGHEGQILVYVQTQHRKPGYQKGICPGTIRMPNRRIDMGTAITLNRETKTISTGNAALDYHAIQILMCIARHLGFDTEDELPQLNGKASFSWGF